jgi:peptidyl-dipeptidase Dcp
MWFRIVITCILGVPTLSFAEERTNPLLTDFTTPFGTPPFDQIQTEDYLPAFEAGIRQQKEEVEAIVDNREPATFSNTVEALELSGEVLRRVSQVFFPINSAQTSDEIQEIARKVAPRLSSHRDSILLDAGLFRRIEQVHRGRDALDLNPEQARLLEETYKDFVRGGALLEAESKEQLRKTNEELSVLSVQFGQNVLKETNDFTLLLGKNTDLAGLPPPVVAAAAEAAKEKGHDGKWAFTLDKPSLIPFLQSSERRDLRETLLRAYVKRGDNQNNHDNNGIVSRIAALRVRRARLLGYSDHASYVLETNMAKTPAAVYELLERLWTPSIERAKSEAQAMEEMIREDGETFEVKPWDWWYYAEKIRKARYDLNDEKLRPYFRLENVRQGAFDVAARLYGISFEERHDLPRYHPDVRSFEVKDADGSQLGILYVDYFPRPSKRAGAWMNSFRKESWADGRRISPIVSNVCNFSKPTPGRPALLTLEEVSTLFHEFGHALHGLLSQCRYASLSGTDVPRDFVELPSQIMENWATHPEVMKLYARHYETGEVIPDELIQKIRASRQFNQGFTTVEYLAAAFLDMDWHTISEQEEKDAGTFERNSMVRIGLIPEIVVRYRSPYFSHIFAGGYAAGYYSYIWSEVLDADAFRAFESAGLFDRATALSFRENILARGGSEEPDELYRRFRGSDPTITPLLERKGLLPASQPSTR